MLTLPYQNFNKRKLILFFGLVLSSFLLHAQKNYAVMVTDSKTGKPIIGASVKIMSIGKIVTTSKSGNIVILASPDDSLQILCKGYKDREIRLAGQPVAISIEMDPKPNKGLVTPKPKKKTTKIHVN